MKPSSCRLVSPADSEAWDAYHRIRRSVLFENRGQFGVYDPNRPDEHAAGHYPKLLMVGSDYVGVVRIDIAGDVAFLRRVAIDERWQRKGHGRTLVELAEAFAGDAGAWSVESDVAPDAVEFYRKCGYEPLEPKSASPSVHMRKHLRAR